MVVLVKGIENKVGISVSTYENPEGFVCRLYACGTEKTATLDKYGNSYFTFSEEDVSALGSSNVYGTLLIYDTQNIQRVKALPSFRAIDSSFANPQQLNQTINLSISGYTKDSGNDIFSYNIVSPSIDTSGDFNTVNLVDRAVNVISLTSDATLILPAAQSGGIVRDLVVRLTLTANDDDVPSPAFDVSATYETEGGKSLDFSEAGTYVIRLTETKASVPASGVNAVVPAVFFVQSSKVDVPTPSIVVSSNGGGE